MQKNLSQKAILISVLVLAFLGLAWLGVAKYRENQAKKVEMVRQAAIQGQQLVKDNANIVKLNPKQEDLFSLGDGYAYYGKYAYYNGKILNGVDGSDLETLGDSFAKAGNVVFHNGIAIEGADAATFKKADHFLSVFLDKNQGYYGNDIMTLPDAKALIDFLSKDIGGKDLGNNYRLYKNKVYLWYWSPQVAPSMFSVNADPATIKSFGSCIRKMARYCVSFAKDAEKVFREEVEIIGADPNTFKLLDSDIYSEDKNSVFYEHEKIDDANPKTFEILGTVYGKDDKSVFYLGDKVVDADPKTFKVIKDLAKDQSNYYFRGSKITKEEFEEQLKKVNISNY